MPPQRIWAFYWHYLRQARWVLLGVCVVGFFVALIEVSLFDYVGRLVDLATESSSPADFFRDGARHNLLDAPLPAALPIA